MNCPDLVRTRPGLNVAPRKPFARGICLLTGVVMALVGCVSSTEVEEPRLPESFTLVEYNGEPLPYSGRYEVRGGDLVQVFCYEVDLGELVMRSGGFRVLVEGLENQECGTGWIEKSFHAGTGEYRIIGDSIAFQAIERRGLAGILHGRIAGDTVTVVLTRLPGLAGLGDRTMTFVPR
ncbi:MAG: hypothetical protein EA422_13545 [Gemmatimonadales bacterium]|nr:MAG: hypothetical protein EA422_13545 [Gemmatimonadales bacterium]